jgi:hypothetical protein
VLTDDPHLAEDVHNGKYANSDFEIIMQKMDR